MKPLKNLEGRLREHGHEVMGFLLNHRKIKLIERKLHALQLKKEIVESEIEFYEEELSLYKYRAESYAKDLVEVEIKPHEVLEMDV